MLYLSTMRTSQSESVKERMRAIESMSVHSERKQETKQLEKLTNKQTKIKDQIIKRINKRKKMNE